MERNFILSQLLLLSKEANPCQDELDFTNRIISSPLTPTKKSSGQ
jgi:hypothetical protein